MKRLAVAAFSLTLFGSALNVHATPSTQIWIPSTDIQDLYVVHFGADVYTTLGKATDNNGGTLENFGLTTGVFSSEKFAVEVGIDYREPLADPLLFNAKIGLFEDALFKNSPALAIGGYDFGTKKDVTDSNIVYGLAAKTFEQIGRFSAGYFYGNDKVLLDAVGKKDNDGLLLSWDRSFGEKFWAAVDYMSGDSAYGALSFGVSYALSNKSSFIIGYDIYNQSGIEDTLTFQLDVNF